MQISPRDKNVLVTGGATGIGRAIAEAFSHSGANVFINHLQQQDKIRQIHRVAAIKGDWSADVSNRSAVNAMVADIERQHGNIDILINNAGISNPRPFLETREADWDEVININLKGTVFTSQAVIPGMLKKQAGCIINMVSELGYLGRENFTAYSASKGALITLTRSLAREFAPAIRVNGIAPGPVMTDLLRGEIKNEQDLQKEQDIPLQRIAEPEEIAGTAVFLASDYARFYCGDILSPNGGAMMR
ncbi:MAG: SDR family oxidoreductase [Gammaproteobacteria bacterium]|nr:SDR family oxidoreductase [Gammaproteobacteria bacterium]